jgi:hypothetical protein
MEKGFKVWRHRSVVPVGFITAGLITASGVIGLPGRTEKNALSPVVQRRVATVMLAQRIRAYAAMAQAHSLCLVQKGSLRPPEAAQALKITLQDLGIDPAVLTNLLVEAVSSLGQALHDMDCSLDPKHEEAAHELLHHEL